MKRGLTQYCVFVVIEITVLFCCQAFAQVESGGAFLSPRVGNTIDREEREYFSLFPGVEEFDSAVVSLRNDSLLFEVARSGKPDTVIKVDPALTDIFRSYIENFEFLFDTRYPESREELQKRGLLINQCGKLKRAELVRFRESVQQEVPEVAIVLADSTGIFGRILAHRDSALMIWRTGRLYRWKDLAPSLVVVSTKDVKGIIRTGPGDFTTGFLAGWLASFAIVSPLLSDAQIHHNSGDDYYETSIIILWSVGVAEAVGLASGLVTLAIGRTDRFYPASEIDDYESLSMFSGDIPPELRGLTPVRLRDMVPSEWAMVRKKVLLPEQPKKYTLPEGMTFRLDYGMNFYNAGSREVGMWMGVSMAQDISVWSPENSDIGFSIRPRLGLGNWYALAEVTVKATLWKNGYFLGGISYQPLSESFGRYSYDLYDHLEQKDIRQSTFFVTGMGIHTGDSELEVQLRFLWQPAIITTERRTFGFPLPPIPGPRRYTALAFTYGFRF
ncbi:MAG: hypothetical protein GXO82_10095 [Chlorobi bacterium]|nr:hypothetical protein [Chlorobiota bacterium]